MNHCPPAPWCVSLCAWIRTSAKLSSNWGKNSCQTFPLRLMPFQPIIGGPTSDSLQYVKMRPAKQHGCEEYESLSRLDKIEVDLYPFKLLFIIIECLTWQYCLNILLPEAVRQILLWRSGKRTSMQLLSSEEEEDLYQEGQTLLNETDWVFDIMRYRQMKLRMLQSKNPKGRNGTTSRPSRGFNAPNYAE